MKAELPLKSIAYFDAVMRAGSLTAAADQLCVTPGAVGQQIRKLEAWLGVPLFLRATRKLHPTPEALSYWENVKPALRQLDEAHKDIRIDSNPEVRLSLPPALASKWLSRRMPLLMNEQPQLKLHLRATEALTDFDKDPIDFAIRYFDGKSSRLTVEPLLSDELRVYCHPAYRERLQLDEVIDIGKARLLHTLSHDHWPLWLSRAGLSHLDDCNGPYFDQSILSIEAARRGQGLVLTSPWLVEDELESGELIQLYEPALVVDRGFYIVYRPDIPMRPAARQLRQWLIDSALACNPAC